MKKTTSQITVSGVTIHLTRKRVKNLNIRVRPSTGRVRVSCPHRMPEKTVRSFVESKMSWIEKHLPNFRKQRPQPAFRFISGELHPYRGDLYKLSIVASNSPTEVKCSEGVLELRVRPGSNREKKEKVLKEWYRHQLKKDISRLIENGNR